MNQSIDAFRGLPIGLQATIVGAGGLGLVGFAYGFVPEYAWVILVALIVIGLLLLAYALLLRFLKKRKSRPMTAALAGNASAKPGDLSDPAAIARLDDLRKQFVTGVEKFRAAGKDVYSTPWYIVVGEPGSGKTEAIRHSQIGFPRGLQDPQQGAGGTYNMNWWFTNKAVILDMAGRVFMDETTEWDAFLGMLRKHRPNCPINGMLLVIPVDTLITDDTAEIEKKAGRIAEQFEHIQRTLGVRFPVFVVITKCDKIAGFREFFSHVDDPVAQSQILGWSKPGSLDEPFKPEEIERHLQDVQARLERRRLALLQDPGLPNVSEAERQEKLDQLYAFPENLRKIAPRLQRYLETIFVASEWSQRPLFLRGIYFTSAMEEGAALDQGLAEALGVAPESLSEDGAGLFRRERSVFLRDMFLKKVFQEQGLVTNATNTGSLKRRRRLVTLSAGILGVVAMLGLTWLGAQQLNNAILKHRRFWQGIATAVDGPTPPAIVTPTGGGYSYAGFNELNIDGRDVRLGQLPQAARANLGETITTPAVFRPVASFGGDLNGERLDAMRALFERIYLQPLLDAARRKLASTPAPSWTPQATAALEELLKLDALAVDADDAGAGSSAGLTLAPLFAFVLDGDGQPQGLDDDLRTMQETAEWLYTQTPAKQTFPRPAFTSLSSQREVLRAIDSFVEHWNQQAGQLDTYRQAEQELLRLAGERATPTSVDRWRQAVQTWRDRFAALDLDALEAALERLGSEQAVGAFARLTSAATPLSTAQTPIDPADHAPGPAGDELSDHLKRVRDRLDQGRDRLLATLGQQGGDLSRAVAEVRSGFRARRTILAVGDGQLDEALARVAAEGDTLASLADVSSAMDTVSAPTRQADDRIGALRQSAPPGEATRQAADTAGYAATLAEAGRRYAVVRDGIALLPASADELTRQVAALGEAHPARYPVPPAPNVPGSVGFDGDATFDPSFNPSAARDIFEAYLAIGGLVDASADAGSLLDAAVLRRQYQTAALLDYATRFARYWSRTAPERATVRQFTDWSEFKQVIDRVQPLLVNQDLLRLHDETTREALEALRSLPADLAEEARRRAATDDQPRMDIRLLGTPLFNDFTEQTVIRWKSLASDATGASAQVQRLTGQQLREEFLRPYGKDIPYYDQLLLAGLELLAEAGHSRANDAIERLLLTARRFPLMVDDTSNPMTHGELMEVRRQIRLVASDQQSLDEVAQEQRHDLFIAQGGKTGIEAIDPLLTRMVGGNVLAGDRGPWFRRMIAITDALLGEEGEALRVTLQAAPFSEFARRRPSISGFKLQDRGMPHRYFAVFAGPRRLGPTTMNTDSAWTGELPTFDVPTTDPIQLAFYRDPGGQERVATTPALITPWTVLQALTWSTPERSDDGRTWHVPVPVESDGAYLPYWVTLGFSRPLPPPETWIREQDWPRR